MEYVIGCDVGSQGTKAVLLSLDGGLVGEAYSGYEIDYPQPLWAQQPVERWQRALREAIGELLRTTRAGGASARGTFMGFTLAHTRAHFTRALLEGSAYAVRDITDRFQAMGVPLRELRVMGSGAKSALWNQIKADVTGLVVTVPRTTETTALGAACLALVGVGACSDLRQRSELNVQLDREFEPRPETQQRYAEVYAMYRETYFSLLPVFARAASTGE